VVRIHLHPEVCPADNVFKIVSYLGSFTIVFSLVLSIALSHSSRNDIKRSSKALFNGLLVSISVRARYQRKDHQKHPRKDRSKRHV